MLATLRVLAKPKSLLEGCIGLGLAMSSADPEVHHLGKLAETRCSLVFEAPLVSRQAVVVNQVAVKQPHRVLDGPWNQRVMNLKWFLKIVSLLNGQLKNPDLREERLMPTLNRSLALR